MSGSSLRIGLVVNDWPAPSIPSGTGRHTRDLAGSLREAGHAVSILAVPFDRTGRAPERSEDVAGSRLTVAGVPVWSHRAWYRNVWGESVLHEWLDREKPEIVHFVHQGLTGLSAAASSAARGYRVVTGIADAWLGCQLVHLVNPRIDRPVCRLPVDIGTCAACTGVLWGIGGEILVAMQHERRALAAATVAAGVVVSDSRYILEEVSRMYPGTYEHLAWPVIGSEIQSSERVANGPLRVGFFGNPSWRKGLDTLVEAIERVPGIELVGFGPETDVDNADWSRRVLDQFKDLPNSRWNGPYRPEQAVELMRSVDIVAVPSRSESLPGVLKEALTARRPVLAARVAGIPELVRDQENGWLLPAGDVPAWRSKLEALSARVDEVRAMRPAPDIPSVTEYRDRVLHVYDKTLNSPVSPDRVRELLRDAASIRRRDGFLRADEAFQNGLTMLRRGARLSSAMSIARSLRRPAFGRWERLAWLRSTLGGYDEGSQRVERVRTLIDEGAGSLARLRSLMAGPSREGSEPQP